MAIEGQQPIKLVGAVAGADLSAQSNQYKFVKYNGTGSQVVLCAALTDIPCGVLQGPAPTSAVGQPVEVVAVGQTKVQSDGATITAAGQTIGTTASGQARANVAGTDTTKYIVGQVAQIGAASPGAGVLFDAVINCASPCRGA